MGSLGPLVVAAFLATVVGAGGEPREQATAELPAVLETCCAENPNPVWVAARKAVDEAGQIRSGALAPGMASALERTVDEYRRRAQPEVAPSSRAEALKGGTVDSIPVEECQTIVSAPWGTWGSPDEEFTDPLRRLIRHSDAIVMGTVDGVQPGFVELPVLTFRAATLIRVRPQGVLLGEGRYPQGLLIVTYGTHFKIGGVSFCAESFEGYDYEPRPGDRVLFFNWYEPYDWAGRLFSPHPRQLVYETRDGTLILPPVLREEESLGGATSLDDVAEIVSGLLSTVRSESR